jgi:hypothetical protein
MCGPYGRVVVGDFRLPFYDKPRESVLQLFLLGSRPRTTPALVGVGVVCLDQRCGQETRQTASGSPGGVQMGEMGVMGEKVRVDAS